MRHPFVTALIGLAGLCASGKAAAEHPELGAFPPPEAGMQRFVITLPHKARGEDESFRVELIAGRTMRTDGTNRVRLGNRIEPRTLQGWGYTYYEVTGPSLAIETRMAPTTSPVTAFVAAPSLQVPYNSRLPIVVYAPDGYQVRYRLWQGAAVTETANPG